MTLRLLLLLALAAAGCDRTFDEPRASAFTVLSPDLAEVQSASELTLRVGLERGGRVVRVEADGVQSERDGETFLAELTLPRGLNAVALDGYDADDVLVVTDTVSILVAAPRTTALPDPGATEIAGAVTATALSGDRVLVAGGQRRSGGDLATAVLFVVGPGGLAVLDEVALQTPRQGHSATHVPGRDAVLLVGGASRRLPRDSGDLLQTAELVVPGRGASSPVPVVGGPIQRSGHQARAVTVDGTLYLYLVGGLVAGSPPSPGRGIDVLRYEPDGDAGRLVVLSPPGGAGELPELPEPALLGGPSGADGRAASLLYGLGRDGPAALRLEWAPPATQTYPVGLAVSEGAPLATPRTGAAGAEVSEGLALVTGGRRADGGALRAVEAVAPELGRTFRFDTASGLRVARSGHAATILGGDRILSLGGFTDDGFAILAPEITTL